MTQMSRDEKLAEISDIVSEILGDAERRHDVLTSLQFDVHHTCIGYNVRFAFDFNVLRPYLFPILDGSYGSNPFYTSLFANSFFFSHGFRPLLLQPYLQELVNFIRYCRSTFGELSEDANEWAVRALQDEYPYVREISKSGQIDLSDERSRRNLLVRLINAVNVGWEKFLELRSGARFASVQRLHLGGGIDPEFKTTAEFSEIRSLLTEARKTRIKDAQGERVIRGEIRLDDKEKRRIERDVEAAYTVINLNRIAAEEGAAEVVVLVTEDEVLRGVLNNYTESYLKLRRHRGKESHFKLTEPLSGFKVWRDTDYLAMYLFLYNEDRERFLKSIEHPCSVLEEFLTLVQQIDVAHQLEVRYPAIAISTETEDKIMSAFEGVRDHLKKFDRSSLVASAPLIRAPGISAALTNLRAAQTEVNVNLDRFASQIVGMQSEFSEWFKDSVSELDRVLRDLEATLARYGLRFDKKKLSFYYPTALREDLPEDFLLAANKVLQLLSEFEPVKTERAIRTVHSLCDQFADLPETYVLWARCFYVQGLSAPGLRIMKSLLSRNEDAANNPEVLFTTSRLCKDTAKSPASNRGALMREAYEYCVAADNKSGGRDPRILRELAYLHWFRMLDMKRRAKYSKALKYTSGNISTPDVPRVAYEFDEVEQAVDITHKARALLENSSLDFGYDTSPLRAIIFNDVAYFRYALCLGKLVSGEHESHEFESLKKGIVVQAKRDAEISLEVCIALSASQKKTLPTDSIYDTLARILLAEYDLGMLDKDISGEVRARLQEALAEAAALTERCEEENPEGSCSRELDREVRRRLARDGEKVLRKKLKETST